MMPDVFPCPGHQLPQCCVDNVYLTGWETSARQCEWKFSRESGKQAWASEILYRLYKRLPSAGECQKILVSQPALSWMCFPGEQHEGCLRLKCVISLTDISLLLPLQADLESKGHFTLDFKQLLADQSECEVYGYNVYFSSWDEGPHFISGCVRSLPVREHITLMA